MLLAIVLCTYPMTAAAQAAGPYVTGHIGMSGGDGGGSVATGGAVAYMMPRRLGFEIEVSVSPGLDFGSLGAPEPPPIVVPGQPPFDFSVRATGRLVTFQTNVVGLVASEGRLRVFVAGGGGIANLHQDLRLRFPEIVLPPGFDFMNPGPGVIPPIEFVTRERRVSRSENALCLNAGGIIEFVVNPRLGVGADVRYVHGFFSDNGLNIARVAARASWRF
jgi:hypothetical protein